VIKEFLNTDGASTDLSGKVARFVDSPCSVRMCTPSLDIFICYVNTYTIRIRNEKNTTKGNDVILVLCTTPYHAYLRVYISGQEIHYNNFFFFSEKAVQVILFMNHKKG